MRNASGELALHLACKLDDERKPPTLWIAHTVWFYINILLRREIQK